MALVGCWCVHFGVRWVCENRGGGYRYQITACACLVAGSVESKYVAPISHYMFNITTVVFDGPSPPPPFYF